MGYTTEFYGTFTVTPPLNEFEIEYLRKFSETRRMNRECGPYFVDGTGFYGQGHDADIKDYNSPPEGQPGLWCQWVPTEDGTGIVWNEAEKFYYATEWITYIIDHFLTADSVVAKLVASDDPAVQDKLDPVFENFGFFHVVNGVMDAHGEDHDDRWRIVITNNKVEVQEPTVLWPAKEEEDGWYE